jgi:hypothetical protein
MPIPSTPSIMPNVLGYAADTVQIPETTPTGQGIPSFRDLFPFITQVDPDAGGVMVERSWMNALFNLLGQHAFFQQSGCVYPWQDTLNYITGSHVKGSDDVEYIALQPSGPDVSGVGAKDPAQQANRAYWVSLASFVSGDFVPDSRRVIAGTGLTGGGPLSADVTLAAKLTDSVSSTDSTTAASAKAVKTAYDLANSKQANLGFTPVQQGGGTGQGSDKIYIGYSESGLKAQADTLDLGNVVTTSAGCTKAPSAALADNATNAQNLVVTDDGQTAKFNWAGRSTGQPEWVWGGNAAEFGNMYTWNPTNFSVNYATNSSNAWQTTIVPNVAFVGRDGAIPNGGTWLYIYVPYDNHYLRSVTLAGGATTPSNDGGIAIRVA